MFKVGDIVRLKYGGLLMSVSNVDGSKIKCIWLDKHGPKVQTFPSSILEIDDDATSALDQQLP